MTNQNGQLILQTLQNLDEPSTILKISKKIADTVGADINDVKDSVKATLDGGVQYGYVQRLNRKYFAAPLELEALDDSEVNNAQDMKALQDRSARRRRGSRRSRRRVGSRRRRRSRR
ncbi:uncharacterized protein LOC111684486 [Lucilia cuprina]|uniref:uncharacterized protein LOC111684486 n=1 Tax=Lucilia cuprina TaxID=7375 RepID=UPI001F05FE2D|nr:uncharacterized protein LOC111684486 [Lucilia cuprina]